MKKRGRPKLKLALSDNQLAELRALRRSTRDTGVHERCQALLLAHGGNHTYEELARQLGRAKRTIQNWLAAYCTSGVVSLTSKQGQGGGRPSPLRKQSLRKDVINGLEKGRWQTGVEIQDWLRKEHGVERSLSAIYYLLGKVGGVLKVPRPVHIKKNSDAEREFKESLHERLEALSLPSSGKVRIWVQDEGRYGLHSIIRRCWGLRGRRIIKPSQKKYQWGYIFGALDVVEGKSEFMFLPTVNLEMTHLFLAQVARSDPAAQHVVIWDQAGFHPRPGDPNLPGNVHLLPLPPYCPELNPVERLWDVVKDKVVNRVYDNLDQIELDLGRALERFVGHPDAVLSLVGDGWLHRSANDSHPHIMAI